MHLLYRLVTSQPLPSLEQQTMGQELAVSICKVLGEEQDIVSRPITCWFWMSNTSPSAVRSQDFVCSLLKTLSLLDCTTHLELLLTHFLSLPKCYPLETVLIPAAEEFDQWSGKKSDALLRFSVSALLNWKPQRRHPLMSHLIWSQNVTITCKCQDCTDR